MQLHPVKSSFRPFAKDLIHFQAALPRRKMGRRSRRKTRNPANKLTDDLIVEILSRLPVKSLCRFKSVSSRWNGLISDPVHRRRLPQTLAGLFYDTWNQARFPEEARHFTSLWERRRPFPGPPLFCPSFSFIPDYEDVDISLTDSCNGLLLCRRPKNTSSDEFCYVVCNPATESWVVLPDSSAGGKVRNVRLAFDPVDSPHFYVFEFEFGGRGVDIYSSQTGEWSYKKSEWYQYRGISGEESSVFFNGLLHIVTVQFQCMLAAVDVVGETWLTVSLPEYVGEMNSRDPGFVGQYHGQLCYITQGDCETHMSIWVLENYAFEHWTLKHRVSVQRLTEKIIPPPSSYRLVTIHPHCNWILYSAGWDQTLMAYNVDRGEVHVIRNLGSDCLMPYFPYVPLYSGSLTDGH
ncbi:hypothetical protein HU200_023440 [Digitaria exilis]|uniref:F-box domain-containing protein n=1 Tax=Digitaria exilis TaxID=1010633 RepID=A0A835C3U8_9POAL|nr:hypothetical protein HU200_023440 [Digitaria exilis]